MHKVIDLFISKTILNKRKARLIVVKLEYNIDNHSCVVMHLEKETLSST